jgi:hypothetical protein
MLTQLPNVGPWAVLIPLALVTVPYLAKVLMLRMALRGTEPKDRPAILKSFAEVLRAGSVIRRRGEPPT